MRQLAEYAMRGRQQALIIALIFTFIPLFEWIGVVIMGLVTLRKGAAEGFLVLIWIALPAAVSAMLGRPDLLLYDVLLNTVSVWLLAIVLREFASWTEVIQIAALAGIIGVVITHGVVNDLTSWWSSQLNNYMQQANSRFAFGLAAKDIQLWASLVAKFATGMQAAIITVGNLINLLFARWLQALLYNPGGLQLEIYDIRLNTIAVIVLALILLAASSGMGIAIDIIPVALLPFMLAAISLIHGLIKKSKDYWFWLFGFYSLLILFFPYIISLLIIIAIADIWMDFRSRISTQA